MGRVAGKGTTHALVRCLCIKICNACTLYDKKEASPQYAVGKYFVAPLPL